MELTLNNIITDPPEFHAQKREILHSKMQIICSENGNMALQNCNGILRETAQKKVNFLHTTQSRLFCDFPQQSANFNCNSAQVENPHKIYYIMYTGPLELRPPMIPSLVDPN